MEKDGSWGYGSGHVNLEIILNCNARLCRMQLIAWKVSMAFNSSSVTKAHWMPHGHCNPTAQGCYEVK